MAANTRGTDPHLWSKIAVGGIQVELFNKPLQKSANDDRDYRLIRLPNSLEAILIHDPTADKAAASMDVAVGSLSDPDDMPGLAHFCEHLLFMGTEKYPKENDYSEFIHANGGSTNAFTAPSNTNYYFSVSASQLDGALARFAAFFYSPLFQPSCTLRELQAVDSEHKKNKQQDGWRLFQLGKGLSRQGHPWRKFSSGHRESLLAAGRQFALKQREEEKKMTHGRINGMLTPDSMTPRSVSPSPSVNSELEPDGGAAGRETRRRLLEWWESQYCSSRMKLAVLGKESLDDLTRLVAENFSPVPNRNLGPALLIDTAPLGHEQMGTVVFAKTIMDLHMLEIAFSLKYQHPLYETKPADFLSHLIGHEGPDSVHALLKKRGWMISLETSSTPLGRGFDAFRITLSLTPEGIRNWREVIIAVFNYITKIKTTPIEAYHAAEINALAEIRFRWKEKRHSESYVSSLSEFLQRPYPGDRLLSASSILWRHDPTQVRDILDSLTVHTGRVMVMCKDFTGVIQGESRWAKEQWYGTEYQIQRLEDWVISKAEGPNTFPELHIPGPNPFIPKNLSVDRVETVKPSQRPWLVYETPKVTLWHKKDDQFWVPRAHVILQIKNQLVSSSPLNAAMTRLVADLVVDLLTEYSYDAQLAGLKYSMNNILDGLQIVVSGYNDKIPQLLRTVLQSLTQLQPSEARLSILKQQFERELENFKLEQPFRIADDWCRHLLQHHGWTRDDILSKLPDCNVSSVESHARKLLTRNHTEMLVHGNMDKNEATAMAKLVEEILNTRSTLEASERPVDLSLILPESSNFVYPMTAPNADDVNSGLTYYCHVGNIADAKKRATLMLYANIAREPCFDQLRTKEQLGYIVGSSMWQSIGSMGWRVVVQSEREPSYLESRVDNFLESLQAKLLSMSEEEFTVHKNGLIAELLEKPKNLGEEASRFWSHISTGYYDFSRRLTNVAHLEKIGLQDVLNCFTTYIHPGSATRRKLSVQCKSQQAEIAKLSVEAAEAFCGDLKAAGVEVDEGLFLGLAAKEPPLEAVVQHWEGVLQQQENLDDRERANLIAQLKRHAQVLPCNGTVVESAERAVTRIAPTIIRDADAFKKTLEVSGRPEPVGGWRENVAAKI